MPEIELKYFPVHGWRGLLTRMVLNLGEIEYTEKLVQINEWLEGEKQSEFHN